MNINTDTIKFFEGFRPTPYRDSVGILTIGYGSTFNPFTGDKVRVGDRLTQEQAGLWLDEYVNTKCVPAIEALRVELTDNQANALASLIYNIGAGNFKTSTLRKKIINNPADTSIPAEFKKWNKAGGKTLPGLTLRRSAEAELWQKK
jgi:lysozyme